MSSYSRMTKHPVTGEWHECRWLDDYFKRHHYGVKFPDGEIIDPWEVKLETKEWEE